MEREHLQELAALHSLDALDGDEYTEVQRLLADSDLLRKEISAFRDVAHLLAQIATPALKPPATLKDRLVRTIQESAGREGIDSSSGAGLTFLRDVAGGEWQRLPVPGALVKLLSMDEARAVAVVLGKLEPGARYPAHRHRGPEDVYMISGDLHIGDEVLRAGDFHHAEAGSVHGVNYSEQGCTILVVLTTQDLMAQLHPA